MSKFTPESAVKFYNNLLLSGGYAGHVANFCGMREIKEPTNLKGTWHNIPTQREAMEVAEFLRDIADQIENAPELTKKSK